MAIQILIHDGCRKLSFEPQRAFLPLYVFPQYIDTGYTELLAPKECRYRFMTQGCIRVLHFTDSQRHSEDF